MPSLSKIGDLVSERFPYFAGDLEEIKQQAFAEFATKDDRRPDVLEWIARKARFNPSRMWASEEDRAKHAEAIATAKLNKNRAPAAVWDAYLEECSEWEELLLIMEPAEFMAQYRAYQKRQVDSRLIRLEQQDEEAFFNEFAAHDDIDRWLTLATVTPEEGAALSLGRNPDVLNKGHTLYAFMRGRGSPFLKEFERRIDRLARFLSSRSKAGPLSPYEAMDYLNGESAFSGKLRQPLSEAEDAKELKSIPHSTREILYKMCLGMALAKYHHNLHGNSNAPSNIVKSLAAIKPLPISISDDAVRKLLKAAVAFLDYRPSATDS